MHNYNIKLKKQIENEQNIDLKLYNGRTTYRNINKQKGFGKGTEIGSVPT